MSPTTNRSASQIANAATASSMSTTSDRGDHRSPSARLHGVDEPPDVVEVALHGERRVLALHAVQVGGEGLGLRVVAVQPDQLVVEAIRHAGHPSR